VVNDLAVRGHLIAKHPSSAGDRRKLIVVGGFDLHLDLGALLLGHLEEQEERRLGEVLVVRAEDYTVPDLSFDVKRYFATLFP
jgi:hypothetical protein